MAAALQMVVVLVLVGCPSALIVTDDHFTELETTLQSLKQQLTVISETNLDLKQDNAELRQKVTLLEGKHKRVIFSVQFSQSSVDNLLKRDPLRFDSILVNVGSGYNALAGVFKAPVSGFYQFSLQAVSKPHQFLALEIVKQGVVVSEAFTYQGGDSDWGDIAFCSSTLRLNVGDSVYVRNRLADGGLYGSHWTQFSGHLLTSS